MRRREFVARLCATAAAWPLFAIAQPIHRKEPPNVGFLHLGFERAIRPVIDAFRSGLATLGYVEGESVRIDYGFADGRTELLPDIVKGLVRSGAKVIVTSNTTAIRAAHAAAPTVPIVSWAAADPVAMGWAQSMARPGGMITGLFLVSSTLEKPLELLKQVRPSATVFAYLFNPANPPHFRKSVGVGAGQLGIKVHFLKVKEPSQLADTFRRIASLGAEGVAIIPDPVLGPMQAEIADPARQHKLPTVGEGPSFANSGCLLAFSVNYAALARRSAWYVDQILKGISPGDLPAEEPTEYKIVINLKTAATLGLTVPPILLARADEVIE